MSTAQAKSSQRASYNSVQLNIVTFVDVRRANATDAVYGNVFMTDNAVGSTGRGTPDLQTICNPGQTLNWIIYAIDADKRPDGTWPPSVKINNLVFLNGDGEDVADFKICTEGIYGGPGKMRSQYTSVYYYWAGTLLSTLPLGVYKYRYVLELGTEDPRKKRYLNFNTPSLNVVPALPDERS